MDESNGKNPELEMHVDPAPEGKNVNPEVPELEMHVDPAPENDKTSSTVLEVENEKEEKKEKSLITIDAKDYRHLKKNNYDAERLKYKTTYILQHIIYPDKIAELRAASLYHACKMIHWKPNQVRLLGERIEQIPDVMDNVMTAIYKVQSQQAQGIM